MRKNNNKKGFTIVELVIVIAVIGILAAVLIPTFASVISNANEKAALQEAQNAYKEAYAKALADGKIEATESVEITLGSETWTFAFANNNDVITVTTVTPPTNFGYTVTVNNGVVSVS